MVTVLEDNFHKEITCSKCHSKLRYGVNDIIVEHLVGWDDMPDIIKPFILNTYEALPTEQKIKARVPHYRVERVPCPLCGHETPIHKSSRMYFTEI